MQLYLNNTSPYARVARMVALEKGLGERLQLVWVDPWQADRQLLAHTPLSRVPLLLTDAGESIVESLLIALYLDGLSQQTPLLEPSRLAQILHFTGLGQGLMDAAFQTVIGRKHQGAENDATVLGQRRLEAIDRTLETLDRQLRNEPLQGFSLADISLAVALDYIRFRLAEIDWQRYPELSRLHRQVAQRSSFRDTAFD